jgi:hypothetical protein
VRGRVDFGLGAGGLQGLGVLDGLLRGVLGVGVGLVVLLVLVVLGGGDCGGERGDVGLQVG